MEVQFQFLYKEKVHAPVAPLKHYEGVLPAQDNILLFNEEEAGSLEAAGLPAQVWRVRQVAFDVGGGTFSMATITLELRNAKAIREELAAQQR
jgi:hypothetical protein